MRTKEERKRCKKGHETTIGKIIYGFLLFLPLLAIGVTCGYAMFNKNAKDSYSGEYRYGYSTTLNALYTNPSTTHESFVVNGVTNYKSKNININNDYTGFLKADISLNSEGFILFLNELNLTYQNSTTKFENLNFILISSQQNNRYIRTYSIPFNDSIMYIDNTGASASIYNSNGDLINPIDTLTYPAWGGRTIYMDFTLTADYIYSKSVTINENLIGNFNTNIFYVDTTLSNVFYSSVDKITKSDLFSWTQNSIIYTGMSNFTTALSITNTFVPTLLTYWLIISIVYFMYDIVLMMLTILHRKIHDLQDSL